MRSALSVLDGNKSRECISINTAVLEKPVQLHAVSSAGQMPVVHGGQGPT